MEPDPFEIEGHLDWLASARGAEERAKTTYDAAHRTTEDIRQRVLELQGRW